MKKLLSLTAAALLLITTGCGRSNAPPASASSGTPSVSAPITEPTVESSDDTTPTVQKDEAAVKPQSSRRLDDSRIIPLYSERFTPTPTASRTPIFMKYRRSMMTPRTPSTSTR